MENKNGSNTNHGIWSSDTIPQSEISNPQSDIPQSAIPNPHSSVPQSNEILIVEDSPVEAELLRRTLIRAGYRVTLAKDGAEGLRALRAHRYALVLSDIVMPLMSGYQLCHEIKNDGTLWSIPVVLLTVLSEPEDIIEALNAGADGYLTKPFAEDVLLSRIHSLLSTSISRKQADERRAEQVEYNGKRYTVTSSGQQMLRMLLSVYQNTISLNRELVSIQMQISLLNNNLESEVQIRSAALQSSEEKFRKITESAQDAIIMMGADQRVSFWNTAAERIFGYTAAEALGQNLHTLIVPEPAHAQFARAFPHFQETGEGPIIGKVRELTALHKGGGEFPVELSVSATLLNDQWYAIGIVRDITERKQAEIKLTEQLDELRRWHEATLGQGMRAIELKREVNELLRQAGQPPRYPSAAAEGSLHSSGEPPGVPLAGEQSNTE